MVLVLISGASRVRNLSPEQFCNHGFVIGKASEAGLGNELYKILTAAALSVMLNRSLIIGQTRHITPLSILSFCIRNLDLICLAHRLWTAADFTIFILSFRDKYPFGDYVSYSNITFTLKEVKHLWRQNRCVTKYKRHLTIRIDDFLKLPRTGVLCSNWRKWEQPIIW